MKGLIDFYDHNGRKIDLTVLGVVGLKLLIPSPTYRTTTEEVEGRAGAIVIERTLNPRGLTASFYSQARNYEDSLILRDKINAILGANHNFYVTERKNPTRRWNVQLEEWSPERFNREYHVFEIPLSAYSGCSETINIERLIFNSPEFTFKNKGDILIDPSEHSDLEIEFVGESENLNIVNLTNGTQWKWTGTTDNTNTILIKGARSLKDGASIFGQTNKEVMTLSPGNNNIQVVGATGEFRLSIKTRHYFL